MPPPPSGSAGVPPVANPTENSSLVTRHSSLPSRLPPWFRRPLPPASGAAEVRRALSASPIPLHTVCEGAKCPNRAECWHDRAAAFLILGDHCTRDCRFCAISHATTPLPPPDPAEPVALADAAAALGLRHVVVTSVTRDDLPDGGASHFAATLHAIHEKLPTATTEVLIPDFRGDLSALQTVLDAHPTILNHNLETTARLHPVVRPQASYTRSLTLLKTASTLGATTKSGLMLGLGETENDLIKTLRDLHAANVHLLTLGQYLPPTPAHHPVARYLPPTEFAYWKEFALTLGFTSVTSSPLARSSYHAADFLGQ